MSVLDITADDIIWETGPELINPGHAAFDPAREYRYALTRTWDPGRPVVAWLMLNPSKADAFITDPTVTRCIQFSIREGYGGMEVVNLFGLRSKDPKALRDHPDPVGSWDDAFIRAACPPGRAVIAAWGAHGGFQGRAESVTGMLADAGVRLRCLGYIRGGLPQHPLYVPGTAPLVPYRGPS